MKKILMVAVVAIIPMEAAARQLECSYDYVTHLTVYKISEISASVSGLQCSYHHEVSPVGGDEMYIMDITPTPAGSCTENFTMKVDEGLYYSVGNFVSSLFFIDFDHAELEELQFPRYHFELADEEFRAPLVSWRCLQTQ